MASVISIEGIGPVMGEKLAAEGVRTTQALLKAGATKSGRKRLADATGIDEKKILRWVNMCDLFRIKGIAEEYSDLLEAAGVDTVKELATRKPDNLHSKLVDVNAAKKLVRQLPTEKKVNSWVNQAKELTPLVTY
jgi:predicted flap endonuclease-1-like 5' DNA nuclease